MLKKTNLLFWRAASRSLTATMLPFSNAARCEIESARLAPVE